MASLSPPGGSGTGDTDLPPERGRAQILLVTAFALAVAFVALSVVINGAIFTQNLATRGDTAGGGDALQQRQQAEQMVGDLLEHVNANYSSTSTSTQEFKDAVSDLSNASSYQQSVAGRAVDYAYQSSTDGTRVYRSSAGNFTNNTADPDWIVAEDVGGTRQFDITVTDTTALSSLTGSLEINVTNGSDTWQLQVYDGATGDLTVRTTDPDGNTETCSASGTPVTINVTDGRLDGRPCAALQFGEGVAGTYDIRFNNSDNVEGRYSLLVDQASVAQIGNATNESIVYSGTVRYTYRTANLIYETDIRVAPGEPDD
jgi:hypothetical protein